MMFREIHLAPESPFYGPPRHIAVPGGTKLCSPAPKSEVKCLIINNGRCQVNFTKLASYTESCGGVWLSVPERSPGQLG